METALDSSDILKDVNPEQKAAICHGEGPLLVIAGAGSGKTRVVTRRIAYLIGQGARPGEILAVTFTNKAAGEMRHRVEQLTALQGLWVSTFHSFGARILRRYVDRLGRDPNFTIYDVDDRNKLVKEALARLELDSTSFTPSTIGATISKAKNGLLGPDEFAAQNTDYYGQTVGKVYRKYEELLKANNGLDFDDLLLKLLELLAEHEAVLDALQRRFRFVLIDEYQDTNRAQYYIAQLLSASHRNLHVTGDPDQSIYSWRGADISNILDFEKDYPEAKVVKLEQNYRSTKRILAASDSVIRNNLRRKPKTLWTENEEGEPIHLLRSLDETEESRIVTQEIRKLLADGFSHSDIAIFYRTNAQSRVLEQALLDATMPYSIVGGLSFYERKEVKDVLAYVRLVVNPKDDVSLERILNVPTRGIGKTTQQALKLFAVARGIPMVEAVPLAGQVQGLSGRAVRAVEKFGELYRALLAVPQSPVARFFQRTLEVTEYAESLRKSADPDAQDRLENVMELVSAAEAYDGENPEGDVRGFLEQSALVQDVDMWDDTQKRVTLMTLHSAKGLEFPAVFIAGFEDGILPHAMSMDTDDGLEEERRLCYVGMTRAKKRLFLSCASERSQFGQHFNNQASRFLDEIPPELIHEATPALPEFGGKAEFEDEEDEFEDFDFDIHDRVLHHRFGVGTVVDVEYGRTGVMLRVRFQRAGEKLLDPSSARLMRL
jgi:DNA helicase-2/ATP-dependent DNA helicase PcrA